MLKIIIKLIKYLKWDLSTKSFRFFYLNFFFKDIPGRLGMEIRKLLYERYLRHAGKNLMVYEGVHIRNIDKLSVGDNVALGVNNFIQAAGEVEIGNNAIFAPDVKIWSANHKYDDLEKPIFEQGYDYKKVVIGNNVWIASNVFIMPGAELGDGVVVSAGAVVGAKKIPPYTILAGNPARKIGLRNRKKEAKGK
ncbi:acyltransferase [Desulfosarcina widdelii]|uniref:Acyltransferase n=1 Tax=Desulfosarcina widdelii TaxID=947919 RepID=A0A5K7YWI1_9BACT|nr:acyltransferase [Desulfosarcina widdelii]BBO72968.1 acyltransferase [Desulfosarcina widdelii]